VRSLFLVFSCLLAVSTAAAAPLRLGVDVIDCDAAEDIRSIVGVELDAKVLLSRELPDHATRVIAQCDGDAAALEVKDPLTSKILTRVVSLADVEPRARTRVIAIAIAELVSASWFELQHGPAPRQQVEPPETSRERKAALTAVRKRENLWSLRLGAGALTMLTLEDNQNSKYGGSLQLMARSPADWFALHFDLTAAHGGSERALGTVRTSALLFGTTAFVGFPVIDTFRFEFAVGMRAGGARIAGEARHATTARDSDVSGAVIGLTSGYSVGIELGEWGEVRYQHEAGLALNSVAGDIDGARVAAVGLAWATLSVSLLLVL
jgi:hypothetical protein